jgi:hypothetical protein
MLRALKLGDTPKPPLKGVPERLIKHQERFDHAKR